MTSWEDQLRDYAGFMAAWNFAPATRYGYSAELDQTVRYFEAEFGLGEASQLERRHLLAYLPSLMPEASAAPVGEESSEPYGHS